MPHYSGEKEVKELHCVFPAEHAGLCRFFREHSSAVFSLPPYHERYRITGMSLYANRCRMIREHRNNTIEPIKDHSDNHVHILDRPDLLFNTAKVPGFIRCFDVKIKEIEMPYCFERILPLGIIIRIQEAGGARYRNDFHSRAAGNTVEEVHRRYDPAGFPVLFPEHRKHRLVPPAPGPDLGCRGSASSNTGTVHRVVREHRAALVHTVLEQLRVASFGQVGSYCLFHNIMWWRGGGPVSTTDYQQVPVTDTGPDHHLGNFGLERSEELFSFRIGDVPG